MPASTEKILYYKKYDGALITTCPFTPGEKRVKVGSFFFVLNYVIIELKVMKENNL